MNKILEKLPSFVEKIRTMREIIISNILLIGQIPSPTFNEGPRAQFFLERMRDSQVDECTSDGYGNPIAIIRGTSKTRPPIFVTAHLDTLFDKDIVYNYTVKENTIAGPGLLDNSLGVAVLASLPEIFRILDLKFESDIVMAGLIHMLGKGNLQGIRYLLDTWSTPVRAGVCIEGFKLGRLNYFSDGMRRCEITCNCIPEKGVIPKYRPNAILIINEVINQILQIQLPQHPRSIIAIGQIEGGFEHGTIPYEARLGFEIRSDSPKILKSVYAQVVDIVEGISHENAVSLKLKTISHLSAARLKYNHPLVKNTSAVMKRLNLNPVSDPSESSLSIFIANKIPAVTLGVTYGENRSLENASMQINPMYKGIAQIVGVIMAIDSGVCDEE
ncbi:MAG: peptidase dimerization domain-containing protein [Proteobacteria bacterium]|nr:peptidase dimerization domain-containing protein [Pseudomonadota bacterium]